MTLNNPFKSSSALANLGRIYGVDVKDVVQNPLEQTVTITTSDNTKHTLDNDLLQSQGALKRFYEEIRQRRAEMKEQTNSIHSAAYRHHMIGMRMRWEEAKKVPYTTLHTALSGDKVFVFVVQDGQAVTLEDDASLFPSDTLITQLRLLEK